MVTGLPFAQVWRMCPGIARGLLHEHGLIADAAKHGETHAMSPDAHY